MTFAAQFSDFGWCRSQLPWLKERTIFLCLGGSHAYGTSTPESDVDLRGIAVPPKEYFLGFVDRFEQADSMGVAQGESKAGSVDYSIYDVRKFCQLAADCNPNVIEVLFTDPQDWVVGGTGAPGWSRLYAARHLFLSKVARHRFSGYAVSQLKRIRTHRSWLLRGELRKPTRQEYGLPNETTVPKDQMGVVEARVKKYEDAMGGRGLTKDRVEVHDASLVEQAVRELDVSLNLIPVIVAERRYGAAMREFRQWERWKQERNPARADMEAKFGYDCKHAMHLVRLLRMAREILERGEVLVKRPDAAELNEIRRGAWTFDQLEEWADKQDRELDEVYARSQLPHSCDRKKVDEVVVRLVESMI